MAKIRRVTPSTTRRQRAAIPRVILVTMKWLALLCALAATAEAGKKRFRPARHYAALFEADRSWEYRITETVAHLDEHGEVPETTTASSTTCQVAEVRRFRTGAMSRVVCDPAVGGLGPNQFAAGIWIATARDLSFILESDLARLPRRAARTVVIAARPRALSEHQEMDEGMLYLDVRKDRGAWCREDSWSAMGSAGGSTLCFDLDGIRDGEWRREEPNGDRIEVRRIRFVRVDP
jgi:hypothetical protein